MSLRKDKARAAVPAEEDTGLALARTSVSWSWFSEEALTGVARNGAELGSGWGLAGRCDSTPYG